MRAVSATSARHPPTASPTFSTTCELGGALDGAISGDFSTDGLTWTHAVAVEVGAVSDRAGVVEAVVVEAAVVEAASVSDVPFKTIKSSRTSGALCGEFPLYTTSSTCSPAGTGSVWKRN